MSIILTGFFTGVGIVAGVTVVCLIIDGIETIKRKTKGE